MVRVIRIRDKQDSDVRRGAVCFIRVLISCTDGEDPHAISSRAELMDARHRYRASNEQANVVDFAALQSILSIHYGPFPLPTSAEGRIKGGCY